VITVPEKLDSVSYSTASVNVFVTMLN